MDKVKTFFSHPLTSGIIGLVIGLIIGLPILGWGLMPVEWKDVDASYLRADLKAQYLCMVIDSYKLNNDKTLAVTRISSLDENMQNSLGLFNALQLGGCSYPADDPDILGLKAAMASGTSTADIPANDKTPVSLMPAAESLSDTATEKSQTWLIILVIAFTGAGAALAYILLVKNRKGNRQIPPNEYNDDYMDEESSYANQTMPTKTVPATLGQTNGGPAAHFMTTYVIGDDLYDDSFSIDAQTGEFLGECGVGISDTIGVGDPKKVTAFEVWLFDKNDIQTVTKVLMSSHAMNDQAIRQRLASKGEPMLVEAGQQVLLETATLQLEARVIELVYGQGALPEESFFERLTLEIAVWPK